jgi:hypothetical protein
MKDPLDTRDDAYRRFNEEAKQQRKALNLSPASPRGEILNAFRQLQIRTKNRKALQEAYDRLTRVDQRMMEDIYYYNVDAGAAGEEALPEPSVEVNQQLPLPSMQVEALLQRTAAEADLAAPLEFWPVSIAASNRYDETESPSLEVKFEK